ncbi:MAG TPA: SdiA-regulated domain-containing protein [Actinomycetota bacterium]|nr:SdiA-regulated domain-containing protein [Actinomycetota bacterium]
MRKRWTIAMMTTALVVSLASSAQAAPTVTADLVRVTDTSAWSSASPDPTGLAFIPSTGALLISDAEVDEIAPLWSGSNLFVAARHGGLLRKRSVVRSTPEPEDIAWRDRKKILYVVDDDRNEVARIRVGRDGRIGTRDDRSKVILHTKRFGCRDPEGLAWHAERRSLIVTSARQSRVYLIRSGRDHRFDTRDDRVRSFPTKPLGSRSPEDVAVDPVSNHLLIVSSRDDSIAETTMRGRPVRMIDVSAAGLRRGAGIVLAWSAADPAVFNLFIVDKGVDNETDPGENDGRLLEFVYP